MTVIIHRRKLLAAGLGAIAVTAGGRAYASLAAGEKKLVFVILRGALDGLSAVVPYADENYRRRRGALAIGAPGEPGGALALGEGFGLHPNFKRLYALWGEKRLAILHAAASPYRERSHFDAQDILESGGAAVFAQKDGWLNRALALSGGAGVAVGAGLPLALQGPARASSFSPSDQPAPDDDTLMRLGDLYAGDTALADALAKAIETNVLLEGSDMKAGRRNLAGWPNVAATLGKLLAAPGGPAAGVIAFDGWDTHANQGGAEGALANRLAALDDSLKALEAELGPAWRDTVVVVATEFGRTVSVNGTRGTDHGTGGVAFALGGAVRGGRFLGDWPGLADSALYERRDVAPANDLRALFKGAIAAQWGLDRAALGASVFPGTAGAPLFDDLVG
jgi:uncharacterized protein (DUF1501 family)